MSVWFVTNVKIRGVGAFPCAPSKYKMPRCFLDQLPVTDVSPDPPQGSAFTALVNQGLPLAPEQQCSSKTTYRESKRCNAFYYCTHCDVRKTITVE